MNEYIPHIPAKLVMPLNMNGMNGRMLYMPAPKNKKREILVIYGHHASLERMYSVTQLLNRYGSVTMPDLPGFGGMDSFYKIGQKPSLDNLADYLASFIKLRYKNKKLTIIGYSFGFLVVTKMLQKYPEIAKRTDLLISAMGFSHREDLTFSKSRYLFYRWVASFFSMKLPSIFFHYIVLNPVFVSYFYARTHNAKEKFADLNEQQKKAMTEFEVSLWQINDARTYCDTTVTLLTVNNCNSQLNLPVWHISVAKDNFFDHAVIEQHMRIIFSDFHSCPIALKTHSMNVIAGKQEIGVFLPTKLRKQLNKKPGKI